MQCPLPGPVPSKRDSVHSAAPALTPGLPQPSADGRSGTLPLPDIRRDCGPTALPPPPPVRSKWPPPNRATAAVRDSSPLTPGTRSASLATVAAPCRSQPRRDCGPTALPLPLSVHSKRRQTARATATVRDSLPADLRLPQSAIGDRSGVQSAPGPGATACPPRRSHCHCLFTPSGVRPPELPPQRVALRRLTPGYRSPTLTIAAASNPHPSWRGCGP